MANEQATITRAWLLEARGALQTTLQQEVVAMEQAKARLYQTQGKLELMDALIAKAEKAEAPKEAKDT